MNHGELVKAGHYGREAHFSKSRVKVAIDN